ncbi:hypothetical protein JL722_6706 [Aureococcus anophagefferens]|nr:hypothetical protein JL722_6706 [Aureococcus anophagefferens]
MVKLISLLTVGALLDATRAVDIDAMRRDLVAAVDAGAVKNTTECHARLLTYEYSLALLPARAPLLEAFDALELEAACGAIVFRGGVHFLGATLELDGRDSGLTLSNYENETAWLSGGVPLTTTWARVANATYETRIDETFPYRGTILGFNVVEPHRRFVRAPYPNGGGSVGVETRSGVGQVKSSDIASYGAPPVVPPAAQLYVADPAYAASASEHFNAHASGRCAFAGDPLCPCGAWRDTDGDGNWVSESYWCSNVSGGGWAEMDRGDGFWNGPVLPTNVTLKGGSDLAARAATWSPKARGEAVVTAWRAQGWFVDMFRVDDVVADGDGGATLTWSYGGFQGGRGWQVDGKKGIIDPLPPFYVENVREELDEADEWHFDNDTKILSYAHNGTGPPPEDWQFVAPDLATLISVVGTKEEPVEDVTIRGLGFRDASITYMDAYFQAKAALTTISSNVFFNGPRSAINFNDGFGGGNVVDRNAIWNVCRQSGDHGPINSWDRQAYRTPLRDPSGGWAPLPTVISRNAIIANYGGSQGVDNDDGSSWYDIFDNFFYGEGLKNDYGGHDSSYHGNVNVVHPYDGQNCINVWAFDASAPGPCVGGPETAEPCSHAHLFHDNVCVLLTDVAQGYGTQQQVACAAKDGTFNPKAPDQMAKMRDNRYYTTNGSAFLKCPDKTELASLAFLQSGGVELGSTEGTIPDDATIMAWGRAALGF